MDVKALATNVSTFLDKHSGELRVIASVLATVVAHLPIDQQDKARMSEALDALQTSAGNIAEGAAKLSELANAVAGEHATPVEVTVSKDDVEEAVATYMHGAHPEQTGELGNGHGA